MRKKNPPFFFFFFLLWLQSVHSKVKQNGSNQSEKNDKHCQNKHINGNTCIVQTTIELKLSPHEYVVKITHTRAAALCACSWRVQTCAICPVVQTLRFVGVAEECDGGQRIECILDWIRPIYPNNRIQYFLLWNNGATSCGPKANHNRNKNSRDLKKHTHPRNEKNPLTN